MLLTFQPFPVYINVDVELLSRLLKDLDSVKHKYLFFGINLNIPLPKIREWEGNYFKESTRIFPELIHFCLSNFPENTCVESMCNALDQIDERLLAQEMRGKYGILRGNKYISSHSCIYSISFAYDIIR